MLQIICKKWIWPKTKYSRESIDKNYKIAKKQGDADWYLQVCNTVTGVVREKIANMEEAVLGNLKVQYFRDLPHISLFFKDVAKDFLPSSIIQTVPATIPSDFEDPFEHYQAVLDQFEKDSQIAQEQVIQSKKDGDKKKISK